MASVKISLRLRPLWQVSASVAAVSRDGLDSGFILACKGVLKVSDDGFVIGGARVDIVEAQYYLILIAFSSFALHSPSQTSSNVIPDKDSAHRTCCPPSRTNAAGGLHTTTKDS